jgi:hypothetical protein
VNRVCEFFDEMGRVAVLKHIDVLEEREPGAVGESSGASGCCGSTPCRST